MADNAVNSLRVPLSLEFFPPKTAEQRTQLDSCIERLKPLQPEYVSVTFGAGGSTLSYTGETAYGIQARHQLPVAPHLSCVGGSRQQLLDIIENYRANGVRRIVALRGDLPSGMATLGELRHASDLVALIRECSGEHFHIEVGCYPEVHPQAEDALADLRHFKTKIDAGANAAITQYFFNADAYFRFVDDTRAAGIHVPIVPGIMPISNFAQLRRFSDMCGAEIPRWITRRMLAYGDDSASIRAFGSEIVAAMCRRLVEGGAPALHFYTLNRYKPTLAVLEQCA